MEVRLTPSGLPKGQAGQREERPATSTFRLLDFKPLPVFVSGHINRIHSLLGLDAPSCSQRPCFERRFIG